jgi:hypothetical protein
LNHELQADQPRTLFYRIPNRQPSPSALIRRVLETDQQTEYRRFQVSWRYVCGGIGEF